MIPNWDGPQGFQHYTERDPIWVKNYTRLLSKDEYRNLSFHQRGVLHSIWLEYARSNRQLRDNTLTLTRQLGHRVLTRDLEALNRAGFIRFSASNPLAARYQDASPEKKYLRTSSKSTVRRARKSSSRTRADENGRGNPSQAKVRVCPECGLGAGHHLADCPRAKAKQ